MRGTEAQADGSEFLDSQLHGNTHLKPNKIKPNLSVNSIHISKETGPEQLAPEPDRCWRNRHLTHARSQPDLRGHLGTPGLTCRWPDKRKVLAAGYWHLPKWQLRLPSCLVLANDHLSALIPLSFTIWEFLERLIQFHFFP